MRLRKYIRQFSDCLLELLERIIDSYFDNYVHLKIRILSDFPPSSKSSCEIPKFGLLRCIYRFDHILGALECVVWEI